MSSRTRRSLFWTTKIGWMPLPHGYDRQSMQRWLFRIRGVLVSPPVVAGFLLPPSARFEAPWSWAIGAGLIAAGFLLRIWAQQHLFYRIKPAKPLSTTGPYTLVRNPIYIANALLCAGAVALCRVYWLAPLTFVWTLGVYHFVVLYEENKLLDRLGEPYAKFLAEIPRWLPKLGAFERKSMSTEHLAAAIAAEIHCLLIAIPCLAKLWLYPLLTA